MAVAVVVDLLMHNVLGRHRGRGTDYDETLGVSMKLSWCVGTHWWGNVENEGGREGVSE